MYKYYTQYYNKFFILEISSAGNMELTSLGNFFCHQWLDSPSGPRPPHYQGITITLRHTTVGRTPLDE
jgi:hypothetical protein